MRSFESGVTIGTKGLFQLRRPTTTQISKTTITMTSTQPVPSYQPKHMTRVIEFVQCYFQGALNLMYH